MDVNVTIEKVGKFERVRFEPGVPTMSEFVHASGGHQLHVVLKGEVQQNYNNVKGTPDEAKAKENIVWVVTDSLELVRWLK